MAKLVYPLDQVIEVKHKRVREAEEVLKQKKLELEREEEKLRLAEDARDQVLHHLQDKMKQLRQELDSTTTSPKVQQMKVYIKVVQEKLAVEEKKVAQQQEQVEIAKKNVKIAEEELRRKRQEVDKLETHRKDWMKEMRKELEIIEGREQDEMGSIIYSTRQRRGY